LYYTRYGKELMDMDVDIKKAEEKIEYLSSDPKTLELYKARERSLHERANMLRSAREGAKEEDAVNFLKLGLSEELVAKGTGLSIEKVIELKKK